MVAQQRNSPATCRDTDSLGVASDLARRSLRSVTIFTAPQGCRLPSMPRHTNHNDGGMGASNGQ